MPPQGSLFWQRLVWTSGTGTVTFWSSNNGIDWVQVNSQTPFQATPTIQVGVIPMTSSAGQDICRVQSLVVQ